MSSLSIVELFIREKDVYCKELIVRNRPCHGCGCGFHGERFTKSDNERREKNEYLFRFRLFSVLYARTGLFFVKDFYGFCTAATQIHFTDFHFNSFLSRLKNAVLRLSKEKNKETEEASGNLLFQAVGTSVDALSLGFTFSLYSIPKVCISSLIIGIVTFILSYAAILVGKKFGTIYAGKADILGGIVLILVAILL